MDINDHGYNNAHLMERTLRTRLRLFWLAQRCCSSLHRMTMPRRRAEPDKPKQVHSGAFNCGF